MRNLKSNIWQQEELLVINSKRIQEYSSRKSSSWPQKGAQRLSKQLLLLFILIFMLISMESVKCQLKNLPPYFIPGTGDMTRFSLEENTLIGSPVYQLKGIDPEGGRLKYSISGPIFSVDRDTGVVRLRQELDRETQDIVEVIISITDVGLHNTEPNTISLRREIPIRDYNDNRPEFIGRPYLASVSESLSVNSELLITPPIIIIDRDAGRNAEITLNCIHESDVCETFDIRAIHISEGNYTAQVILKKALDYETRSNYIINITAIDNSLENRLSSFATIAVNIIDVQDQLPIFIGAPYSISIDENTMAGKNVLTINAFDGDISIPRGIHLQLIDEKFGYFMLRTNNGTAHLYTTNIPLDRENPEILQNGGVYVFSIMATEIITINNLNKNNNNRNTVNYNYNDNDDNINDSDNINTIITSEQTTRNIIVDDENDDFNQNYILTNDTTITQITIVINDMDDHLPTFNGKVFNITIAENLSNGMPLPGLSVIVDDRDMGLNSRYRLKLRNVNNSLNVFDVSPTYAQGRTPIVIKVLNSTYLDYDVEDISLRLFQFDVLAFANNQSDLEASSARINVELFDINDNTPQFEQTMYHFIANENLTVNTVIGMVKASDLDSGSFGQIKYRLKGFGVDYFMVNANTGSLMIRKALDYEKQNSYSLTMVAEDGGGRETNAQVFVRVIDVNDNYPQFEYNEYTRIIREGANNFEPQFKVRATDADGPTQGGGHVFYSIVSENSISGNVFRIDETTGEITLQKIARSMDTERGEYNLVVAATDFGTPPLTNTTHVYVRVGISGNQRPIFKGHFQNIENVPVLGPPSYRVSIPENAPSGYNVTTVSARDPDGLDEQLRYRIVGANDNFEIDERSGVITVSPQARIDRDSNMDSFEITINAVDAGLPIPETATTTVYVNVKDVNDEKPKFEQSNYAAYVSERTNVGERILKVRAIDKDLNSKLNYSINQQIQATTKAGVAITNRTNYPINEVIRIDPETGILYVNGRLCHDIAAVIMLIVEVRDLNAEVNRNEQIDTTEVIIYVQSFKDTNPIFLNKNWSSSQPILNIHIMEEMPIESTLFTLKAEDPITNVQIQNFQLLNPLDLEYFYIHERSGEVILRKRLDYEQLTLNETQMLFEVRASTADGQRSTITKVNVTIENVNDNSPIFDENVYSTNVLENKMYPYKIIRIHATDKDISLTERDRRLGYHQIKYSLHGEYANLFVINNDTGEIIIAPKQTIDREKTSKIHLQVKAEDSPGRPTDSKYNTVELFIDVLDVNDNAPIFNENVYTAVIAENVPIDTFVLKVTANDLDIGPNGEVLYEIYDADDEIYDLFQIDSNTGEIRTKSELTGKGRADMYQLHILAKDNGDQIPKQKSLSAHAKINLYIGDVSTNDGLPYFIEPKEGQLATIAENAPRGSFVFQVIANDPDHPDTPSGTLYYHILDDTLDANFFHIDESTGLITTTVSLDRETKDLYNIILEVYDDGQPRQSVTRVLQIRVLDVDDCEPVFNREVDDNEIMFYVFEEEATHTIVGNVTAIDDDIGENAAIDYIILNGNEDNVFYIERTNQSVAILRTNRPIDRELIDSYTLTLKCIKYIDQNIQVNQLENNNINNNNNREDNENNNDKYNSISEQHYDRYDLSQIRIKIIIMDIDDNLPEFEYKTYSLGIRINIPIDTIITKINVIDQDAESLPINLAIENITFVPQYYKRTRPIQMNIIKNLFILNNHTGELSAGSTFGDYVDGYFQLYISANNSIDLQRKTYSVYKIFIIRDKSLLKFIFTRPIHEIQNIIRPFEEKIKMKLKHLGLDVYILDAKMLQQHTQQQLIATPSQQQQQQQSQSQQQQQQQQQQSTQQQFNDYIIENTCFQMLQNDTAISINDMQKLMESERLKRELFDTYVEYGVTSIEPCTMRAKQLNMHLMSSPGTWLVIIATFIGLAAITTSLTAYCLKKKYKKQSKRNSIQTSRATTESYGVSVPTLYLPYCEPIYGPL